MGLILFLLLAQIIDPATLSFNALSDLSVTGYHVMYFKDTDDVTGPPRLVQDIGNPSGLVTRGLASVCDGLAPNTPYTVVIAVESTTGETRSPASVTFEWSTPVPYTAPDGTVTAPCTNAPSNVRIVKPFANNPPTKPLTEEQQKRSEKAKDLLYRMVENGLNNRGKISDSLIQEMETFYAPVPSTSTLKNKLAQSIEMVVLSSAEKQFLLERIG